MSYKLVLFDIDETLIYSDGDGVGRRALSNALINLFGIKPQSIKISMSGKTDPQILSEIMAAAGCQPEQYQERLEELFTSYLQILKAEIRQFDPYKIHAGAYELLAALSQNNRVFLGLLTGNIERGARLKLERFGLNKYFPIGAYGSDSFNRLDLPAIARQRAEDYYQNSFEPKQIVIIGDSIYDVLCAQNYGAVSIAVNTGKTPLKELEALSPDFLFPSLQCVDRILAAILP